MALLLVLTLAFALGGSSRGDAVQLLALRPLSVLLLGYALYTLRWDDLRAYRAPLCLIAAYAALVALQLVPLPWSIWSGLPGRVLVVEIDQAARLGRIPRAMSLTPPATWNALWSLALPISAGLLTIHLTVRERTMVLHALLVIGAISALMGILQILGDPQGPLYWYRWTYNGLPVGLFANRNHQSVFLGCLIPIAWVVLAAKASVPVPLGRRTIPFPWAFTACVAVIFTLVLVTGSRAGFAATLLALASLPLLAANGPPVAPSSAIRPARPRWVIWLIAGMLAGLGFAAVVFNRALTISRMLGNGELNDMRVRVLPTVRSMIIEYAPWGSGFGSFETVYQVHEPDALLGPTYMNHAHNDWIELILEGGVPAVGLLLIAFWVIGTRVIRRERSSAPDRDAIRHGRLGVILLVLLAFASAFDYPLRVPALACVAMFALIMACQGSATGFRQPGERAKGFDPVAAGRHDLETVR